MSAKEPVHIDDTAQEDSWFSLISRLRDGAVVPVIGPDLLRVTIPLPGSGSRSGPLYRLVAEDLLASSDLQPRPAEVGHAWDLHAAVARVHSERNKSLDKVRLTVARLVAGLTKEVAVPNSLRLLAQIDAFDLFVSVTCDDLMFRAAAAVPGAASPQSVAFSTKSATGAAVDIAPLGAHRRAVYRLFGKAESMTEFAVHEGEVLEYLFVLQSEASRRVRELLSTLRHRDLLFIGCSFPDWMGRSLLRLARDAPLDVKSTQEFFSDASGDPALTTFVSRFSSNTLLFPGDAGAFVAELARRWSQSGGRSQAKGETRRAAPPRPAGEARPKVFVSYASENAAAARRIAESLADIGFSVWFDKTSLIAGDEWPNEIREAIQAAQFFVPILSKEADRRDKGEVFGEWREALEARKKVPGEFILPIGVDDEPPTRAGYRAIGRGDFAALFTKQMLHAPDGVLDEDGLASLSRRLEAFLDRDRTDAAR